VSLKTIEATITRAGKMETRRRQRRYGQHVGDHDRQTRNKQASPIIDQRNINRVAHRDAAWFKVIVVVGGIIIEDETTTK
jgi:hypothetical protein